MWNAKRLAVLALAAAIGVGAMAAVRPGLVKGTLNSPRALGLGAVLLLVTAGLGLLLSRTRLPWLAAWGTAALPAAVVTAVLLVPTFSQSELTEDLPTADPAPSASESLPPAAPVTLTTGGLRGVDHRASGTVSVLDVGGRRLVRFAGVDIEGTPDPHVYLVPGHGTSIRGGTRLGTLKADKGSYSYDVPAGFDIGGDFTVMVWCRRFDVAIAAAPQAKG